MPNLMEDNKIGAALINAFYRKIESNEGNAMEFAERMKQQASSPNQFGNIVNRGVFQSDVKKFIEENADTVNFPRFQRNELNELTLGSYQIKLAISYIVEHLKKNGKFLMYTCPHEVVLKHFKDQTNGRKDVKQLRVYLTFMYSRFSNNSKHAVYVMVDSSLTGINGIIGHTCDCKHGLRVVGCCSY